MFSRQVSSLLKPRIVVYQAMNGGLRHVQKRRISYTIPGVPKRSVVGLSLIGATWGASLYGATHENDSIQSIAEWGFGISMAVSFFSLIYIPFGPAAMMYFLPFTKPILLERVAVSTMKRKTPAIHEIYGTTQPLKSREKELTEFVSFVTKHFGGVYSILVSGMKGIGKSVKGQELVKRLKEAGIPCVYINVGPTESQTFVQNASYSLGIVDTLGDHFSSSLTFGDIAATLEQACLHFKQLNIPNVIVLDDVSKDSANLKALSYMSRKLSENNPLTVVVAITSDSTDTFWMPSERRRIVVSQAPLESTQIKDYLATEFGLTEKAMNERKFGTKGDLTLVELIDTEFMSNLVEINLLMDGVGVCKTSMAAHRKQQQDLDLEVTTIDQVQLNAAIEAKKKQIFRDIRKMCGDPIIFEELTKFVKSKDAGVFHVGEFTAQFGDITETQTIGYKLLEANYMYYRFEDKLLVFHYPIVRNAIKDSEKLLEID